LGVRGYVVKSAHTQYANSKMSLRLCSGDDRVKDLEKISPKERTLL